jgi:integrative and conjugative element protein (TIGR02256 family)
VVVGTANRGTTGQRLAQHLVAFQVSPVDADTLRSFADQRAAVASGQSRSIQRQTVDAATRWLNSPASLNWLTVHDARPEITVRRDTDTPMAHLRGKAVEVWGCGALGGWAAEYIVRAGAARVILRDRSVVRPGLEVRQPYGDDDIGYPKADRLARRLRSLGLPVEIESHTGDIVQMLGHDKLPEADLIIDATASRGVAAALERVATCATRRPWLASLLTDATATRGALFIAVPDDGGALLDVGRRAALALYAHPTLQHFYDAFLAPARNDALLQPEPGCSEPTFRGSAADASSIAGQLVTLAAEAIGEPSPTAAARFMTLPHAPLSTTDLPSGRLDWPARWSTLPEHGGYIPRLSPEAMETMRSLADAAGHSPQPTETGGLLFGEWDDAARVVWVDTATKPPNDSKLSPAEFVLGTDGTAGLARQLRARSNGTTVCIGTWHTHPSSSGTPSRRDRDTMQQIMASTESATMHALIVILGGSPQHPDVGGYIEHLDGDHV